MRRFLAALAFLVTSAIGAHAASTINALQQGTFPFPDPSCAGTGTPSVNLWIAENGVDKRTTATQLGYMFQGALAPACPFTYEMWWNTAGSPAPQLKVFTTTGGSAVMGAIDATNNLWIPPIGGGVLTTVAGAATVDLGAVNSSVVEISGSASISSFGSSAVVGSGRTVRFSGASTLIYNASSMILPSAANVTTLPGDTLFAIYLGTGNWLISTYQGTGINSTIVAVPGDYTISSSDCGKTLEATGAFKTITLANSSGFASACEINVRNGNTTRAQKLVGFPSDMGASNVTCGGSGNSCLFPGQTVTVQVVNGSWGAFAKPGRWSNVDGLSFNVDNSGSDNSDCLGVTTGACATIQHATDLGCFATDWGNRNVAVAVAHGTYAPFQVVTQCLGQNGVSVTGDSASPASVIIQGNDPTTPLVYAKDKGFINLSGFRLQSLTNAVTPISCGQYAHFDLFNVIIDGAPGSAAMTAIDNCKIDLDTNITFACSTGACTTVAFLSAGSGGIIGVNTTPQITGNWAVTYGCVATGGGIILTPVFGGAGFAGVTGQKFLAITGGTITGGANINCPGNTTGVQRNAALYATPADPIGVTTGSSALMMGLGGSCTIVPLISTSIDVTFTGNISNGVIADGAQVQTYIGNVANVAAPANGAAPPGASTAFGTGAEMNPAPSAGFIVPFSVGGIVAITPGNTYWLDLGLARIGGSAAVSSVTCKAQEVR